MLYIFVQILAPEIAGVMGGQELMLLQIHGGVLAKARGWGKLYLHRRAQCRRTAK